MLSIQDYRNGRYQGQVKDKLPHGIGIFMQINLTFVIAEWAHGYIDGSAVIIFPDASTFCGLFQHGKPTGTAFYELSHDDMKVIEILQEKEPITAIILPLESKILQISKSNLEVTREYGVSGNQDSIQLEEAARVMKLSEKEVKFYRDYPNCYTFFQSYFCRRYQEVFEEIVITINGYKEYRMGFKEEGLGVKLEPVKESYEFYLSKNKHQELSKVHRCLDGKVYMIREMGMMSKQNTLVQYGLKTTNEMLKGYTIEEGVFELPHTLIRYQSTTQRPKSCTQTFANHLKRSFHYVDTFMHIAAIEEIGKTKRLLQQDVINHNKEALAHSLIQTPNKLRQKPVLQKQESSKASSDDSVLSSQKLKQGKRVQPVTSGDLNWSNRLMEVKKQIYNSIELKKANKSYVDYTTIAIKQDIQTPKQQIPILATPPKKDQSKIEYNNRPSSYIKESPDRSSSYVKDNNPPSRHVKVNNPPKQNGQSKSKSKEYIDPRKNGSITPVKQPVILNRSPPKTNPISRYQRGQPIQNKPASRYQRPEPIQSKPTTNRYQRAEPTQYKTPTKEPERTSPGFILKNDKTKSTLKSSPSRPRVAYRNNSKQIYDNSKQIQTIPTRQPKRQDPAARKFRDDLPVASKYSQQPGISEKRSPQKSNLGKFAPARQNDSPSKVGYLARNKKKKLLNELDNFGL